jgi:hypothetical protein
MAWSENKTGGNYNTITREFICDSREDIELLPEKAPQGSSAFCIEDGSVWMKKSGDGQWKEL